MAAPKGSGLDSFTVGWSQPKDESRALVGRYHLFLQEPESGDVQELFLPVPSVDHMFINLKPATKYTFKVTRFLSLLIAFLLVTVMVLE